jgi:selenocysteine lyase/cysteine desulfurase
LLQSVGVDAIAARLRVLTDHLIAALRAKGYTVVSPRGGDEWSGIVSFTSPSHDLGAICRRLRKEHRTEIALREGRLRVSAHFYNTNEQLDRLIAALPAH